MASQVLVQVLILSSLVVIGLCRKHQGSNTIKEKDGVYDCIDFYKQPAFDNPLLKNRTIKVNLAELQRGKATGFELYKGDCPIGTIPILRAHSNSNNVVDNDVPHSSSTNGPEHCVALVHTNDFNKQFFGAGGGLTLYKPMVQKTQWSSVRIKLINSNEYIEAGWMVNPSLFNNNEARLYVKFSVGGKECINLQCPGFVQFNSNILLGDKPSNYSVIGGPQKMWNITIDNKYNDEGDWWLSIGKNKIPIGVWPKELFTTLAEAAQTVEWGGEISNPGGNSPYPEMGNGMKAIYNTEYSASIIDATIVDENGNRVHPGRNTHKTWDCENLYTVLDQGYVDEYFGRLMFYGGTQ